ncbi:putative quinol monooxygenase [Aestuariispira insulae]|uniref:Antibiotic biosynthesis monooxygenase n=1 Tax=Aestuariispira insulae TaxID=1461337 RepID=A0A3D9H9I8_9PROT|nr:putative quinol monooxygenase [Aestuariispira insulae]RED46162.1 antibiotic biosynthesis monooxygenase [Aestuariispira insulae]
MHPLWISAGIEVTDPAKLKSARIELDQLRHHTISEKGCLQFEIFQDNDTPGRFTLWECWTDQSALDAHFAAAHTQAYLAQDLTQVVYIEKLGKLKINEEAAL